MKKILKLASLSVVLLGGYAFPLYAVAVPNPSALAPKQLCCQCGCFREDTGGRVEDYEFPYTTKAECEALNETRHFYGQGYCRLRSCGPLIVDSAEESCPSTSSNNDL